MNFRVTFKYVRDKSLTSDDFLYNNRLYQLEKDESGKYRSKDALSRRTKAYQQYCSMKGGSPKYGPIKRPETKYTVHHDFNLGEVDSLWVMTSSADKSDTTLKDRCKLRMENRAFPKVKTFDEYVSIRTSCYILEEKDGVFFCDCWEGMKGKNCHHSGAMMYNTERWLAESDVRSVPLGKSRKPGRPKKNPHCLLRSPTRMIPDPAVETDHDLEVDVDEEDPLPAEPDPADIPTRKSKRVVKRKRAIEDEDNIAQNSSRSLRSKTTPASAVLEEDDLPQLPANSKPPKKKARMTNQTKRGKGRGKARK